jgi:hypothetical protein
MICFTRSSTLAIPVSSTICVSSCWFAECEYSNRSDYAAPQRFDPFFVTRTF